jgi:nicotinamidase/pyrazinamidase
VKRDALIIVDMQPDFLPGGALGVHDGDRILAPLRRLLEADLFGLYAATQDWHPPGHISFASTHPGHKPLDVIELYGQEQVLWPDHCVQGTPGAELVRGLPWEMVSVIVRKATTPDVDSYSTFRNNWDRHGERPPTGLAGYLRERGVRDVWICGLARDYCVKWSAEDAVHAGFTPHVIWDLTRPVDPASDAHVRDALEAAGVVITESDSLLGSRV